MPASSPTQDMAAVSPNLEAFRRMFQCMSVAERYDFVRALSYREMHQVIQFPYVFLHDKQIIPVGNWMYCLFMAGRSTGKSYLGGAWIAEKIRGGAMVLGLCGPTYDDVAKVMIPAIEKWFMPHEAPTWSYAKHTLTFPNGAVVHCYSSDKEIRGPNLEYLWCDEICVWADGMPEKIKERYEHLTRALRVGSMPQCLITSTPKQHPFFTDFMREIASNNERYTIMRGTMFDNTTLPAVFIDEQRRKYGDTRMGRQEIYGELLDGVENALFQPYWIQRLKWDTFHDSVAQGLITLQGLNIGVDPAITSGKKSDLTGIVAVAKDYSHNMYVIKDSSGKYTPHQWASVVNNLFGSYRRAFPGVRIRIVCEVNQGGELVSGNLCALNSGLKPFIVENHVSKGKDKRMEPAAAKYERSRVYHVGDLSALEAQMFTYDGDEKTQGSPDRVDALCSAINDFTIVPKYTQRYLPASIIGS